MKTYDEIVACLRKAADRLGGKAELMRHLGAKKPTFYRALSDENPVLPAPEVLCQWLDKLHVSMAMPGEELESYELVSDSPTKRIYEAVKRIPKGRVASYGTIARLAGDPKMARAVGNALHKNPDPAGIPCFRVVNGKGELAGEFAFGGKGRQAALLREDGVEVTGGKVDMEKYGWDGS